MPVVAADWDGYRETLRDGIDGFLVPTLMTPPGFGDNMAHRHLSGIDTYDMYIAAAALNVAVDVKAAADAYTKLADDAGLRQKMGEAGRNRARETFEWKRVYGLYRELWGELAERRQSAQQRTPRKPGLSMNPAHPDPFRCPVVLEVTDGFMSSTRPRRRSVRPTSRPDCARNEARFRRAGAQESSYPEC